MVTVILKKYEDLLAQPVLAVPPSVAIQTSHTTCQTSDRFLSPLQVHLAHYANESTSDLAWTLFHAVPDDHKFTAFTLHTNTIINVKSDAYS